MPDKLKLKQLTKTPTKKYHAVRDDHKRLVMENNEIIFYDGLKQMSATQPFYLR